MPPRGRPRHDGLRAHATPRRETGASAGSGSHGLRVRGSQGLVVRRPGRRNPPTMVVSCPAMTAPIARLFVLSLALLGARSEATTPKLPELWKEFPDDTAVASAVGFDLFSTMRFLASEAPTERKLAAALAISSSARDRIGTQSGAVLKTLFRAHLAGLQREATDEERLLLALFGAFSSLQEPPYAPRPPSSMRFPVEADPCGGPFVRGPIPRLGCDPPDREVRIGEAALEAMHQIRLPPDDAALRLMALLTWLPACRSAEPLESAGGQLSRGTAQARWYDVERELEFVRLVCTKACNLSPGLLVRMKRFLSAPASRCPEHRAR